MTVRSISDPVPVSDNEAEDQPDSELESVLRELIVSHNMLHDRLVRLEAIVDKLTPPLPVRIPAANESTVEKPRNLSKWRKG